MGIGDWGDPMSGHELDFDAWLDAELRNVAVPSDLTARLKMVPRTTDAAIDAALGDVPIPPGLLTRLYEIADPTEHRLRWQRLAMAASILVALMAGMLWTLSEPGRESAKTATSRTNVLPAPERPATDFARSELSSQMAHQDDLAAFDPRQPAPDPAADRLGELAPSPLNATRDWLPGPDGHSRFDPVYDVMMSRWRQALGSEHVAADELPEPLEVADFKPAGVVLPLVPEYIQLPSRWHVHPLVSPADPRLSTSEVPLAIDAASFELTRRMVAEGELPPRDKLATEEFFPAIDYHFPRPAKDALALTAAGGPAPFRQDGRKLLQVGVQARELPDAHRGAARVIVAMDVSASMAREGRLAMARAALMRLVERLRPEDRVSLVAFSENAEVLAEDATASNHEKLLAAIASLAVKRSTNVGAGLRAAYAIAGRMADGPSRIVLLTDGLTELAPSTVARIEELLADAVRGHVTLDVVDVGPNGAVGSETMLARFARAGGGLIHHATSADQIGRTLLEIATGQSQLVANNVRLHVVFNAKTVAAYRLIGHEAQSLVGLKPAPLDVDFYAEQSAVALYEVILMPGAKGEAATAELTWHEAGSNLTRIVKVHVRTDQFPAMLLAAAPSLQAAAIVAEAAEVLRGVPEVEPFAPFVRPRPAGGLGRVINAAAIVDTQVRLEPSFAQFVAVLQQAEHAKPHKSLPKK
jgi:Ca-activated chloride channel homolog